MFWVPFLGSQSGVELVQRSEQFDTKQLVKKWTFLRRLLLFRHALSVSAREKNERDLCRKGCRPVRKGGGVPRTEESTRRIEGKNGGGGGR